MICSTGVKGWDSDLGDWVTNGRRARWCYFSKWGGHAQYWTRINENIAFHSVTYSEPDTRKLNVKSYNKLGRRASHGCIRMLVSDAKWMYDNIKKGTTVHITEDLPLDEELTKSLLPPDLDKKYMLPKTTAPHRRASLHQRRHAPPALPHPEKGLQRSGCVLASAEASGSGVLSGCRHRRILERHRRRGQGLSEGSGPESRRYRRQKDPRSPLRGCAEYGSR